jgi:hypothetical protein
MCFRVTEASYFIERMVDILARQAEHGPGRSQAVMRGVLHGILSQVMPTAATIRRSNSDVALMGRQGSLDHTKHFGPYCARFTTHTSGGV